MTTDHDHPYKQLFCRPELVADLLTLTMADLARELDLGSLDRRNGTYVSEDWRERESDVIWRVRWSGQDLYIYLLLEFQSTVDPDMAVRVMTYVGLLYQDLRRTQTCPIGTALPPVLPMVLYNGESPWLAPRNIREAIAPAPDMLEPFLPHLQFLLIDEVRMQLKPDQSERNLAAAVFGFERHGDIHQHVRLAAAVRTWLNQRQQPEALAEFQRWWIRTVSKRHQFPTAINPFEDTPMMAERVDRWIDSIERRSEAKGQIKVILAMVAEGELSNERALVRLQHLHEQQLINDEQWAMVQDKLR